MKTTLRRINSMKSGVLKDCTRGRAVTTLMDKHASGKQFRADIYVELLAFFVGLVGTGVLLGFVLAQVLRLDLWLSVNLITGGIFGIALGLFVYILVSSIVLLGRYGSLYQDWLVNMYTDHGDEEVEI